MGKLSRTTINGNTLMGSYIPTRYNRASQQALLVRDEFGLNDFQTLTYDHICRGDFYLVNDSADLYYNPQNNGPGWEGSREFVASQMRKLISKGLVKLTKTKAPRDGRYTIWYFHRPDCKLYQLVNGGCYVSAHALFYVKNQFGIQESVKDIPGRIYVDQFGNMLEFIYKENAHEPGVYGIHHWTYKWNGKLNRSFFHSARNESTKREEIHPSKCDFDLWFDEPGQMFINIQNRHRMEYPDIPYSPIPNTIMNRVFIVTENGELKTQ